MAVAIRCEDLKLAVQVNSYAPQMDTSEATVSVTHLQKPVHFIAYYSIAKTGGYDEKGTLEAAEKEARLILKELAAGSFVVGNIQFAKENVVNVNFDVHYKSFVNASVNGLEIAPTLKTTNSQIFESVKQELSLFFSEAANAPRV